MGSSALGYSILTKLLALGRTLSFYKHHIFFKSRKSNSKHAMRAMRYKFLDQEPVLDFSFYSLYW